MSERYWMSGVQLGMIQAFLSEAQWKVGDIRKVLRTVEDDQFIGRITAGTEVAIVPIAKRSFENCQRVGCPIFPEQIQAYPDICGICQYYKLKSEVP